MNVLEIEKEIDRVRTLDCKLIMKRRVYRDKAERAVKRKKISSASAKVKLSEFDEKYLDMRLKLGLRFIKLYDEKIEIIGKPKTVKVDETKL